MLLARAGKFNEAHANLKNCKREEEIHYTLARMSCNLDRPDVAREYLSLALKAHPTYLPAHQMMAELNNPANSDSVQPVSYGQPAASPNVQVGGIV
jgi:hypothetical protein